MSDMPWTEGVLPATGADTLDGLVRWHARRRPEATFLVFEPLDSSPVHLTYGDADRRAEAMAALFGRLGLGPGDRFHVHLPNCVEFYDCWLAAARTGAVMVPTNPLATADELAYVLSHAGCRVSITQEDLLGAVLGARERCPRLEHVLQARTGASAPGVLTLDEELTAGGAGPDGGDRFAPGPLDVVSVLYTSGTTSRPKGVLVTHAAYLHVGEVVAQHVRLRPDDRNLIVLPLFHGNAQYYSTMSTLVTGASIAMVERFSASRFGSQAARLEATVASLFAAPIRMILAHPETPDDGGNRLRLALFAQNVTDEQVAEFERRFGCPLVQLYGMTETVAPPIMSPLYGERRPSAMGRPVLGSRVRIVDDKGVDVAPGAVGELLVGGEPGRTLMAGYLDNPEATAEALAGGWLHTGDNARADDDGYLYFVDRGKDMIKRAGENVATGEVERVVNEHPAVFESAAIGVPDEMRDEAIKVFVVLHQGAQATGEEIIAFCAERLARFKVPSFVAFADELPRTSVGKIQKHVLRRST